MNKRSFMASSRISTPEEVEEIRRSLGERLDPPLEVLIIGGAAMLQLIFIFF
jgi:hypothetical protein